MAISVHQLPGSELLGSGLPCCHSPVLGLCLPGFVPGWHALESLGS